jgi:hypothetical protein
MTDLPGSQEFPFDENSDGAGKQEDHQEDGQFPSEGIAGL